VINVQSKVNLFQINRPGDNVNSRSWEMCKRLSAFELDLTFFTVNFFGFHISKKGYECETFCTFSVARKLTNRDARNPCFTHHRVSLLWVTATENGVTRKHTYDKHTYDETQEYTAGDHISWSPHWMFFPNKKYTNYFFWPNPTLTQNHGTFSNSSTGNPSDVFPYRTRQGGTATSCSEFGQRQVQ